jgi:hypothetical protein
MPLDSLPSTLTRSRKLTYNGRTLPLKIRPVRSFRLIFHSSLELAADEPGRSALLDLCPPLLPLELLTRCFDSRSYT